MKAIGFYQYLPVEDPSSLVEVEVPTPEPGGRDLLVRVKAVSVNPVDVKVRSRLQTVETEPDSIAWLEDQGAQVIVCGKDRVDLASSLGALSELGIERVMVEGGSTLVAALSVK